jgi:hypothetical protein
MKDATNTIFNALEKEGLNINEKDKINIINRIENIKNYKPKIGLFGKTGVGKSSLTNALFGQDICSVNDVESCTRNPQEVLLNLSSNKRITLLDVPGVGENQRRDEEYAELYQKLLPELDVVLWLLKADDRAYTADETFYKNIVKPHIQQGKPLFFVINQVDKIEPFREWDEKNNKPGKTQAENIEKKIDAVSKYFDTPKSKIIPVSANEKYNLTNLVKEIVYALPPEKLISVVKNIKPEFIDNETRHYVKRETANYVFKGAATGAAIGAVLGGVPGAVIGGLIGAGVAWIEDTFCFITTATVIALGKDNSCYELNTMRFFRDNWVSKRKFGERIIKRYYRIAPKIVNSINAMPDKNNIYNEIYNKYIYPCVKFIEKEKYFKAFKLYSKMVNKLNKQY